MPLSELFYGSAFRARGDPDLTNRYYAQSWLVVHYLLRGPRSESGELERYLDLVHAGGDPVGVVPQAFGVTTEQLEKELRVYVKMRQMAYRTMPIEQFGVSVERFEGVPLSEAQGELARAHLCLRMGKLELADELLSSVAVSEAAKRADVQLTLAGLQAELADDSSWERSPSWVANTIPALTEFPDPEPMSALARRCGHGQLSTPYRKCVVDGSARDCIKLAAQHDGRTEEVHRSCMEGFERHACELGSPLGCARLGNNYVKPWGPLSNRRAFDAFERACALGFRFTCLAVADMIPPPRFHMLRYHGVLAAHAKARPGKRRGPVFSSCRVVPGRVLEPAEPTQMPLSLDGAAIELEAIAKHPTRLLGRGCCSTCSRSTS